MLTFFPVRTKSTVSRKFSECSVLLIVFWTPLCARLSYSSFFLAREKRNNVVKNLPPPPPRYSDLGFAFEILSTFAAKKRLTSSDQILQGCNFSSSRRQGVPNAKIHVRNTGNICCKERLTSSEQLLRFLLDAWNLIPLDFMLYNSPEISKLFCNYDFFSFVL